MKKLLLLIALLFTAMPSHANLWKNCGIGHWIAGPTWNGYLAITTNVTFDLGTTATISQVVTPGTCAGPLWSAAKFINDTYPRLEEDTAQGQGEHLMAMLDIFECDSDVRPQVVNSIRQEFNRLVSDANYVEKTHSQKAEAYYLIVEDKITHFGKQCNLV